MRQIASFVLVFFTVITGAVSSGISPNTTQVVRGQVVDAASLQAIPGVNVIVLDSNPILGVVTDLQGSFRFEGIPVGRLGLKFSFVGYYDVVMNNLQVDAGKEVIITVKMEESVSMMKDIVIKARGEGQYEQMNEMATLSSRGFNLEETQRYAGSRNDPARMASNFAGVSGANDARNDIIIRGNSPAGLLWRLEGVNIPNPNHFAATGTTGGPVSILNNNLLADSEFYTGAFPACYGNAVSGVFDIALRNGNNENREFLAQIGFNGLELGMEGPFKKGSGSSYLAHYRYSVPALMKELNFNTGTGSAVPYYQDLSFKMNFPVKQGKISIFGIGGKSHIDLLGSETTAGDIEGNLYNGSDLDIYNTSSTGVAGMDYFRFIGKNTYFKNSIAFSASSFGASLDTVYRNEQFEVVDIQDYAANDMRESRLSWRPVLHHKFNVHDLIEAGMIIDYIHADMKREIYQLSTGIPELNTIDYRGNTVLIQSYLDWQHRFNDQWTINSGIHYQNLTLNNSSRAVEPRIGITYQFTPRQSFRIAYGLHHQSQPSTVYFTETKIGNGGKIQTNTGLGFTESDHFVIGYNLMIAPDIKMVIEAYHQRLSNVPVERRKSYFSMLNYGADFGFPDTDSLVNEGTGQNTGIELTLEKYFTRSYYFLVTGSFYNAKYTGSDGIERNTAFNGSYVMNGLLGKKWTLGKRGNAIALDLKITYAGNKRYVPIDLDASRLAGYTVYQEKMAYETRYPDYFRTDVKFTFRLQSRKITQEWVLDIQNITDHQNVFLERYDPLTGNISTTYQMGLWPMVQYRVLF